jgi:hypothetical protein
MAPRDAAGAATVGTSKLLTAKEIQKHSTEDDCWIVIHGKVRAAWAMQAPAAGAAAQR